MNKKRTLATAVVLAVLCLLIYLQVHTWKKFDWATFWSNTSHIRWINVVLAVALTYFAYVMRAVRWRIFLKPMCQTTTARLLAPQFIGFAGLALLGRPGEMIRPYLIARKESLTFSSQMAVWLVERIFDMGSVAIIFIMLGFRGDPYWATVPDRRALEEVRWSAILVLGGVVVALTVAALVLRRSGYTVADRLRDLLEARNPKFAHGLHAKIVSFTDGLQTISGVSSFTQLFLLSAVMWVLIALAYWLVTHAYGGQLAELGPASILLLLVSAMFGSLIQLPGVGGGSQLATIAVLNRIFGVSNEIAVSCGMLLWVATFMSVIPVGLLLAHRERLSLRAVAAAEQKEEATLAE
jgi:glycosyltransferase 2 family protein